MPKYKQPTWTTLVLELLTGRDDFMTARQIRTAIGANVNQASAALSSLRQYRCVDCVVEPNGIAWWFATPETDQRCSHLDERTPEDKPRNRRVKRTKKEKLL